MHGYLTTVPLSLVGVDAVGFAAPDAAEANKLDG